METETVVENRSDLSLTFECSQELWKGFIPIEFKMDKESLAAAVEPGPFYAFSSRYSYIAVAAVDAIECLRSSALELSSDVWFEYDGVPLRR